MESTETGTAPTDVDYGLYNRNGRLFAVQSGQRIAVGPTIAEGDVISLLYDGQQITYRWRDYPFHVVSLPTPAEFYVDTAFRSGIAQLGVAVDEQPAATPGEIPVYLWRRPVGGVTATGNSLSYSGQPTGWVNSARSQRFSRLGVQGAYRVVWTLGSDPTGTRWVAGLGARETGNGWQDVDYGLASANGQLRLLDHGQVSGAMGPLMEGDTLGFQVDGQQVMYLHNGQVLRTVNLPRPVDFYVDTSFRRGAMELEGFLVLGR